MTTANDFVGTSAAVVLEQLCPGGDPADGVEVEQDWEDEATIIRFSDGSALRVSGGSVEVVRSVTVALDG